MNDAYVAKIKEMIGQLRAWRAANPDVELLIECRAPKHVMVAAVITDAITTGFIKANPAAMKMFNDLGWIEEGISYLMLKVAIEHERDKPTNPTTSTGQDPEETGPRPRF